MWMLARRRSRQQFGDKAEGKEKQKIVLSACSTKSANGLQTAWPELQQSHADANDCADKLVTLMPINSGFASPKVAPSIKHGTHTSEPPNRNTL